MKIFLFFIICSFSCGEQKPVNEDITEATVAPVNIESVENNRNIFNISKKDVLSSRFMQNTSLKTDTLNVNSAKSNIFKIPLLNAGSSTAHISTASTNLNNTIVMTTASPFLEKSSKNNDTTSDTTNKIIISDTIDHFLSTLTMNELLPNDYINEKDVVNVTLIFNETSPTIDATTERILHTLSPSSSTPPKLQECNISSSVIEKYSDSAKPVIPLDEQDTSNENNSNGVSNKITISTTDIMQLQISYNISQNGISSTSGNVPTYPHETSSLLVHQDEVLTNSDSGKTNTLWSPSPVLSNLSELLITTEQTVFNKASVENNSEIFSIQSKDVEYIRTGLDVGADHKNLSINLNTSDVQASENDTELAPSSAMSVEISKEVTEIIIVEDSSTANTSTITTESSILEQEIVNAESLIQDLLDPAIVLAKRSLQSTEIQKNIDRRSRSRSEHSDETKSTGNVTNATPERVQRHTWVDYSDDNYGDLHMAENFCDHHSKHIYRTHYEHKERKFKVDNPHINDSKSRPFKLIPIFSGQKLKAIASSASNTWGLFLLVMLLGYALVEVPRGLWNASKPGYTLHYSYFKAAKLSLDKCEAEETVDDVLESLQAASIAIGVGHPFHCNLETIFQKVPAELKDRMNRRQLPDDTPIDSPSEKSLIRLHKNTIKSLQTLQRTETQWGMLVEKIFHLEDVAKNQVSHDRRFKHTFPVIRIFPLRVIYNPTVEWYWNCVIKSYAQKTAAVTAAALSVAVVWSEVTFFNKSPVLSLFAQFVKLATVKYDYFTIEILSTLIIAYLCYCAYSTVLKIRVLNLYYLAPHHQTNEYSLIFSGMMLCRLTPPMCLNFLGLIHMDSHIIKTHILETHYTQVMGHMDVAFISDGFNIYFPMAILAFCLATHFSLGSRLLSMLGFQQFLGDDELTTDLVEEGRELIKRERRKRQRAEDSMSRRREFQERFNNLGTASRYRTARQSTDTVRPLRRDESTESARAGLLRDVESTDYYVGTTFESDRYASNNHYDQGYQAEIYHDISSDNLTTYTANSNRVGPPPRGLFDDI